MPVTNEIESKNKIKGPSSWQLKFLMHIKFETYIQLFTDRKFGLCPLNCNRKIFCWNKNCQAMTQK